MKKRILSIFLAILMIAALLPTAVFADGNPTVTLKTAAHGLLVASTDEDGQAVPGDLVMLMAFPDEGYRLQSLTISTGSGTLDYDAAFGYYVFEMPEADVTVTPVFGPETAGSNHVFFAATEKKFAALAKLFGIPREAIQNGVLNWLEDEQSDTFEDWNPFGLTLENFLEILTAFPVLTENIKKYIAELPPEEQIDIDSAYENSILQGITPVFYLSSMIVDSCFTVGSTDTVKCVISEVFPLAYKMADAMDAWQDKDFVNFIVLCGEIYQSIKELMYKAYQEDPTLMLGATLNPENGYTALRARLKAEVAAVAAGVEESKTFGEEMKNTLPVLFALLSDKDEVEDFTQYVDDWLNNPYAAVPGRLIAPEDEEGVTKAFHRAFTEFFCSVTAEYRAFFACISEDGSATDPLRCLLDHIVPCKENIFNLIDAIKAQDPEMAVAYMLQIYASLGETWMDALYTDEGHFPDTFTNTYRELHANTPACIGKTDAKLQDGAALYLQTGGKKYGSFRFTETDGGWLIEAYRPFDENADPDKLWLAASNGRLTLTTQEQASVWTYANGAFSVKEATQTQTPGFWFLFWYIPARTVTKTTTYYLSSGENGGALSTVSTPVTLFTKVLNPAHDYDTEHPEPLYDGTHLVTCKDCGVTSVQKCVYDQEDDARCKCGALNPEKCDIDVKCTPGKKTVYGWFWTRYTVHTMTIEVTGKDAGNVSLIEYSLDDGETWTRGTTITSNTLITTFKVRVTDEHGIHIFDYHA